MKRRHFLTATILSFLGCSKAHARYCSDPYCRMCNKIFGPKDGYELIDSRGTAKKKGSAICCPTPIDKKQDELSIRSAPQHLVDSMLDIVYPREDDLLCDLGCGDGNIVITAAKKFKCQAIGIEIDEKRADLASKNVKDAGVDDRVVIIHGDARVVGSVEFATIVTMYQYPELMKQLLPRCKGARVVASINHEIPDSRQIRYKKGTSSIYISNRG